MAAVEEPLDPIVPESEPAAPAETPAEENPPAKAGKSKKAAKEPKAKKPAARRKRNSAHPPYEEVKIGLCFGMRIVEEFENLRLDLILLLVCR